MLGRARRKAKRMLEANTGLCRSRLAGHRPLLVELQMPGQLAFVAPILAQLRTAGAISVFFSVSCRTTRWEETRKYLLETGEDPGRILCSTCIGECVLASAYLSPTPYGVEVPPADIPKVQVFHGLADKGLAFGDHLLEFNAVFMPGPYLKKRFETVFLEANPEARRRLRVFEVGYPKSDALINRSLDGAAIRRRLGVDPRLPTVMYAPSWNPGASLRTKGIAVLDALCELGANVLVKLHPMSLADPADLNATGGVDWRAVVDEFAVRHTGVTHVTDHDANESLFVTDVLVTDIGGIGLEFMTLDRPVVYHDVPEFFAVHGRGTVDDWGRDAGVTVATPGDLRAAVEEALAHPHLRSDARRELVSKLIYNPGRGAEVAADLLRELVGGA